MTSPPKIDYIEMMDKFAYDLYDTARPTSKEQPVVIEDLVNVFKELAAWAVKRNEIINSESEGSGGAIERYAKGIEGGGDSKRARDTDAAASSGGILAQLGTRKKSRKPSRLPPHIEGDGGDSGSVGPEQPTFPVNGSGILHSPDGDVRSDMAEIGDSGPI